MACRVRCAYRHLCIQSVPWVEFRPPRFRPKYQKGLGAALGLLSFFEQPTLLCSVANYSTILFVHLGIQTDQELERAARWTRIRSYLWREWPQPTVLTFSSSHSFNLYGEPPLTSPTS